MPIFDIGDGIPVKWNDAVVYGDLQTPEAYEVLSKKVEVLIGRSAKQPRGTWLLCSGSVQQLIESKLSRHKHRVNKDGEAIVFAKAKTNGNTWTPPTSDLTFPLCGRSRDDIEAVNFAGFDIDDGADLMCTVGQIRKLGLFCIVYTTMSHGKPQEGENGDIVDKFRLLFPLEEAFQLSPNDPVAHIRRCGEWRERLTGFATEVLGIEIDETGCDVNRLFYTPRHKPGDSNWFSAVIAGRALSIEDMPHTPSEERSNTSGGLRTLHSGSQIRSGKRPILSDGFDLIDWQRDWGALFLVRDFFDCLQWEFGQDNAMRQEARVLCPSDHMHSNAGDVHGCWIKDGTNTSSFVIYCHHNSCSELGSLDQLVELESHVQLPDGYETLSALLCDQAHYSCQENGKAPVRERYLRWDPTEDLEEAGQ